MGQDFNAVYLIKELSSEAFLFQVDFVQMGSLHYTIFFQQASARFKLQRINIETGHGFDGKCT
ncbi:hypothetical protein D3C81_2306290 [compost metagenome]